MARPFTGRHRARPSATRRAVVRLALAAVGGLLVVLVTGAATGVVGPGGASPTASRKTSAPSLPGHSRAGPTSGRTIDIAGTPPVATQEPPASEEPPPAGEPPPREEPTAADVADDPGTELWPSSPLVPEVQSAVEPPPEPAPVPTVRPGDTCPVEGGTAVMRMGETVVCTATPGDGQTRWRRA